MGNQCDGKWHTEEDFERDFWAAAKYNKYTNSKKVSPPQPKPATPSNQSSPRKSKIKSIYFDPELTQPGNKDDDEDDGQVVYRLPSRGRHMNPRTKRPGGKISDSEFYKEVHSSIRQVSGLGYSNELLEHAFKNRDEEEENKKPPLIVPEIHFLLASSSQSSSTSSGVSSPALSDSSNTTENENRISPLTKPSA